MEEWQQLLVSGINHASQLPEDWRIARDGVGQGNVEEVFPVRINAYYKSLISDPDGPIGRQVIPDPEEVLDFDSPVDPLAEEEDSPVPAIVHRYPDRVLFLVTNQCPIYCRYCTRKRMIGTPEGVVPKKEVERGIAYLREHAEVRDVVLSGGDPLMLKDDYLDYILTELRAIPHLEILRIGSRVPSSLPQRVTPELCAMLKKHHPLFMNLHFNHPDEITPEASRACNLLADAGIPLGCQTVLMKGVNDQADILKKLFQKLLTIRVKPYYLYQADLTRGANHFRTPVATGLRIMRELQGFTSGMAIPHFVIDAPGGGGKIPVLPEDYLVSMEDGDVVLKNYEGRVYTYPDVACDDGSSFRQADAPPGSGVCPNGGSGETRGER
jgi:lysine 2,3-aminomutase